MRRVLIAAAVLGVGATAVSTAGMVWLQPQPNAERFNLERGALRAGVRDVTLRDAERGKDIELRFRVPDGEAPENGWPLVVFSHGAGGSRSAFGELLEFWASHGYASVAITHADSLELKRREGGRGGRDLLTPEGRRRLRSSVDLKGRVDDCRLVLDRMDEIAAQAGTEPGAGLAIDREKIAIAGHSAGAFTAQLCAGVRARAAGVGGRGLGFTSLGDDRFKAAIIISGQGTTSRILGESSWSDVKMPMLVIAGSLDGSPPEMGRETPESRRHPFEKSRGVTAGGPPAYLLFIEGATHSSYAGKRTSGLLGEEPTTDVEQIQDAVATSSTLFLDAHLKGAEDARGKLAGDAMEMMITGKVEFLRK